MAPKTWLHPPTMVQLKRVSSVKYTGYRYEFFTGTVRKLWFHTGKKVHAPNSIRGAYETRSELIKSISNLPASLRIILFHSKAFILTVGLIIGLLG